MQGSRTAPAQKMVLLHAVLLVAYHAVRRWLSTPNKVAILSVAKRSSAIDAQPHGVEGIERAKKQNTCVKYPLESNEESDACHGTGLLLPCEALRLMGSSMLLVSHC